MTTFDLAEVRAYVTDLFARLDRCDDGEGPDCGTLDGTFRFYAEVCCEFRETARQWSRAVFAGRVAPNADVDRLLRAEGQRLFDRAKEMSAYRPQGDGACRLCGGSAALGAALWEMHQLLDGWLPAQLAVGPSARHRPSSDPGEIAEALRRIAALPPLPADWQPTDPRQQKLWRKIRAG